MSRSYNLQVLCAACVLAVAACQRNDSSDLALPSRPSPGDALAWSVERVEATRHLATSTLETRDATAGNEFVVLEVRVRNPDGQPQVVSEGALIAVAASGEQRFTTPVSMLTDEFLTLQVLPPSATARGKIAYEVPERLAGAFYWMPGNSSRRILLHVPRLDEGARTLASVDTRRDAPSRPARTQKPMPSPAPERVASRERPPPMQQALSPRRPVARSAVAGAAPTATAHIRKPVPASGGIVIPAAQEQARRDRCEDMLTRNAPSDAALRPFYLLNCPDYPLPPGWRAAANLHSASALAMATPAGTSPDCSAAAVPAVRLVCGNAYLANLDRRLSLSLSRALGTAQDPAALRRDQDDWRRHVRDRCRTIRCLELAYGRRTAHIDALARIGP
ncbi:MAG: hypothetical protein ACJ8GK_04685 [Luteimonas sp.]